MTATLPTPIPVIECRACKEPILWCRTAAGQVMSVDEVPSWNGTLIVLRKKRGWPEVRTVGLDVPPGFTLHRAHFDSCRHVNQSKKEQQS